MDAIRGNIVIHYNRKKADYKNWSLSLLGAGVPATSNCQGNWWTTDCYGVGTKVGSDEATIGKRNAITPVEQTNW